MTNPYSTPNSLVDEHREVPRYGMMSLGLCVFGVLLTLPELWSNAFRPLDNTIGNLMGVAIIIATGVAAYAEWFPRARIARIAVYAQWALAIVASIVFVRFVTLFVPILTPSWAFENPGVIMGFVFALASFLYIGLICRRWAISRIEVDHGEPRDERGVPDSAFTDG